MKLHGASPVVLRQIYKKILDKLMEHFVAGTTARCASELIEINRNTAAYYHKRIRQIIASHLEQGSLEIFDGEADKHNHINGIENFWNQAKRHLRKFNGVPKRNFPLFLKEAEWRFNNSDLKTQMAQLKQWVQGSLL